LIGPEAGFVTGLLTSELGEEPLGRESEQRFIMRALAAREQNQQKHP